MKNIRIENIEIRKTNYKNSPYEFVKWWPNQHYQQRDILLKDGWIDNIDCITFNHCSIHNSCFINPETCYVIAWMKKDKEGYYMETVGSRLLEISEEELKLFFDIYRKADKKLNK